MHSGYLFDPFGSFHTRLPTPVSFLILTFHRVPASLLFWRSKVWVCVIAVLWRPCFLRTGREGWELESPEVPREEPPGGGGLPALPSGGPQAGQPLMRATRCKGHGRVTDFSQGNAHVPSVTRVCGVSLGHPSHALLSQ